MREYIKSISVFVICRTAYLLSYISAIKASSSSAIFNFNDTLTIGQHNYPLNVPNAYTISFQFLRTLLLLLIHSIRTTNFWTRTFEPLIVFIITFLIANNDIGLDGLMNHDLCPLPDIAFCVNPDCRWQIEIKFPRKETPTNRNRQCFEIEMSDELELNYYKISNIACELIQLNYSMDSNEYAHLKICKDVHPCDKSKWNRINIYIYISNDFRCLFNGKINSSSNQKFDWEKS